MEWAECLVSTMLCGRLLERSSSTFETRLCKASFSPPTLGATHFPKCEKCPNVLQRVITDTGNLVPTLNRLQKARRIVFNSIIQHIDSIILAFRRGIGLGSIRNMWTWLVMTHMEGMTHTFNPKFGFASRAAARRSRQYKIKAEGARFGASKI